MNTKILVSMGLTLAILVSIIGGASAMMSVTAYRDGGEHFCVSTYTDMRPGEIYPDMGNIPTVTKVTASREGGEHITVYEVLPAY